MEQMVIIKMKPEQAFDFNGDMKVFFTDNIEGFSQDVDTFSFRVKHRDTPRISVVIPLSDIEYCFIGMRGFGQEFGEWVVPRKSEELGSVQQIDGGDDDLNAID